jgi:hypothetical protein
MHRHVYLHICLLKMNNYIVSSLKYLRFSFCWLWKVNIYRIDLFSRFIQLELLINFSFWKTSVTVLSLILCTGCFKWSYCGTTTVNNGTLLSENIYIYTHTGRMIDMWIDQDRQFELTAVGWTGVTKSLQPLYQGRRVSHFVRKEPSLGSLAHGSSRSRHAVATRLEVHPVWFALRSPIMNHRNFPLRHSQFRLDEGLYGWELGQCGLGVWQ